MFEKIEIEGFTSPRATHYALADGLFCRIVLIPQESKPDRFVIEAQAFEIDADGTLIAGPDGIASRTPGTSHTIARSALGDTCTIQPGWVRVVGDYDAGTVGDDFDLVTVVPAEKNTAGKVYNTVTGIAYRWDEGCLERIRQGKAKELQDLLLQQADALQELGL